MGKAILTKKILLHTVLLIGVLVSIFPFYWLVVMSTNQTSAIFAFPPRLTFGGYFMTNFHHVLERRNRMKTILLVEDDVTITEQD